MRWIRLSNPGSFDLEKRLRLIGASVKEKDNCIGEFGSGLVMSLSSACRRGLQVKIATNQEIYTLTTVKDSFRDKEFEVVAFKTKTGRVVKSPFVSNLGSADWSEKWFIFRELYANMLDENGTMDLVDGLKTEENSTHIFLPYNEFITEYNQIGDYFKTEESGTLKEGTGRCYKKSVYVGTIPNLNLDMWDDSIKITESRTMLLESAESCLSSNITNSDDSNIWKLFFESKKAAEISIYCYSDKKEVVDKAFRAIYGENYVICPKVDSIISQCIGDGLVPVLLSECWSMGNLNLPNYLTKLKNIGTRALNSAEQILVDKALKAIEFITDGIKLNISVIDNPELARYGDANLQTGEIRLHPKNFKDYTELLDTLIHEAGHVITKASDYDNKFLRFFTMKLAKLCE